MKIGVDIQSQGYNLFITGMSGTGKYTTIKQMLEQIRPMGAKLNDYAYVNNFKDPDRPILLTFTMGQGIEFKKDGEFVDIVIGRGDAPQNVPGQWKSEGSGYVSVFFPGESRPNQQLEIIDCENDVLRVRRRPLS